MPRRIESSDFKTDGSITSSMSRNLRDSEEDLLVPQRARDRLGRHAAKRPRLCELEARKVPVPAGIEVLEVDWQPSWYASSPSCTAALQAVLGGRFR